MRLQATSLRLHPPVGGAAPCLAVRHAAGRLAPLATAPSLIALGIAGGLLIAPRPTLAQDGAMPAAPVDIAAPQADASDAAPAPTPPGEEQEVAFEADEVAYDSDTDVLTASGDVLLRQGDQSVRADTVTWNRMSGEIVATGDVRFLEADGNELFTDQLELTDDLRAGAMANLLLAFREGGRLAAASGERRPDGDILLERAAYTACSVTNRDGCPKDPSWRVTAERVFYDAQTKRVRFRGAFLELFGQRVLPLPGLSISSDGSATSGFLVPNLGFTNNNGVEVSGSYYWRIAENRDATLGAYLFSEAKPMISGQYRELGEYGAYQVTGYLTHGRRLDLFSDLPRQEDDVRGYIAANGRWQFSPYWSLMASGRHASDRTFLRRYDISQDDRLRSTIQAERIDNDSYLSIAGWATQLLLVQAPQGQVPIALPVIDYRRRLAEPVFGGTVELQANSLAITRTAGQDTQRAFIRGEWNLRRVTPLGQEITLTGLLRGDVYHTDDAMATPIPSYRGTDGWHTRGVAIGAVDVKWPFVGGFLGGTQVLTPRAQFVISPKIRNLSIPNEDSRAIELEDSNLFSLNRFPGYDRVEDGPRVTFGMDWQANFPGWRVSATMGQSYRLTDEPVLFPEGTGLTQKFSDYVGRVEVRYRDFIRFTHRFRLDKDNFAVRRNEIDAAIGTDRTYLELGYLRLNRDIDLNFEDLLDREELRAAGRVAFARYWSVFGSAVVNLTDREEDPSFTSDGFKPLRTRLGVGYSDDCLEFGVTWRRDYVDIADSQRGESIRLYFSLKNLGFR